MNVYNVGYTCGVFDLFHRGHLILLKRCKELCSHLIVGVCDDEYIREIKHTEPVMGERDRLEIIRAIRYVDEAMLVDIATTEDKLLALEKFKFDVLFSGSDWQGSTRYRKTEEQFAKENVAIEYLPYTFGISTSFLKKRICDGRVET